MHFYLGTSGYSYKEWKGNFYPQDLKPDAMLLWYAQRLPTVEINNTFYRMPSEKMLKGWASEVPEGFSFVIKASQRITHHQKLKDADDSLVYLLKVCAEKRLRTLEGSSGLLPMRRADWCSPVAPRDRVRIA